MIDYGASQVIGKTLQTPKNKSKLREVQDEDRYNMRKHEI